jgi:hypothetical protein
MNDIVKVDTKSIGDRLHDKVRSSLLDILTDEEWRAMVQREVEKFCTDHEVKDHYGHITKQESDLGKIVKTELELVAKQKLQETLQKDEWVGTTEHVSEVIQSMLEKNASKIVRDLIADLFQNAVDQMGQNIAYQISQSIKNPNNPNFY